MLPSSSSSALNKMASFYGSKTKRRRTSDAITSQCVINDLDDFDLSDSEANEEVFLDDTSGSCEVNDILSSNGTGSMYTFEGIQDSTPLSRPIVQSTESNSLPESGFCTPSTSRHSGQHQPLSFDSSGSHCGESNSLTESGLCTPSTSRHSSQHQLSFNSSGSHRGVIRRRDNNYIPDLLERQNNLILELLSEQKKLSSTIESVKNELMDTKENVDKLIEAKECSDDSSSKMKRKYPSSLTERLSKIHTASGKQFDTSLSSSDVHNKEVKQVLTDQITSSFSSEYNAAQIKLAIQRLYEGLRRSALSQKPENLEKTQAADLKKKFRARRERLYARRSKYVSSKLRQKWENIDLNYMSEEEDAEDGNILVKRLPWRSEKLNELVEKLDEMASEAAKTQKSFVPERKTRVLSEVNSSLPHPADAPDWALRPQFRKRTGEKRAAKEN